MFNGDSRDILCVQIMPKLTQTGSDTTDREVEKYFLLSFNFAIYILYYGENSGEIGFFIMFDNQKKSNVLYSPRSKISHA